MVGVDQWRYYPEIKEWEKTESGLFVSLPPSLLIHHFLEADPFQAVLSYNLSSLEGLAIITPLSTSGPEVVETFLFLTSGCFNVSPGFCLTLLASF